VSNLAFEKPYTEDIKAGVWYSLVAHVVVICFFTVKMVFFPNEDLTYQSAIRIDLVALPDKLDLSTPPQPAPDTAAPPQQELKKETPKEEAISLKKKQNDALAKLKAMDALEKIKQDAKKEEADKKASKIKYKGNILSPGTELSGLNKLQHEEYIVNLDRHIKQHWTLPEWLAKKNYSAQVRVRIDDKGRILSKQLMRSSGNNSYDDIVLTTIDKAAPFPTPPEKFTAIVSINGILIGFPE
jgi:colicin import membrane protein